MGGFFFFFFLKKKKMKSVRWICCLQFSTKSIQAYNVIIHYAKTRDKKQTGGHVYIRSFLTHKEYNNPANWNRKFGTEMRPVLANPAEMIAQGAPRVIHNDRELAAYTEVLFKLTALDNPSPSEAQAIELLTLLVDQYEQAHYSVPAADAVSVVRFLIEQQGLTQRDLIPQFGSESAVSMFLRGQRKLTLEQVRKLSARFKIPADVFLAEE